MRILVVGDLAPDRSDAFAVAISCYAELASEEYDLYLRQ